MFILVDNILEIKNLSRRFSDFLLNDISINIPYGKVVGLIGENGAGKTTLINLVLNQKRRDNGEIRVFGLDNIKDEKAIKKDIGFVMDECCFHTCLNPNDIQFIIKSIYPTWNCSQYQDLLSAFNVNRRKKILDMSKGMKTKLMLATAMSHNPHLLILDEVTSGLDPVVRDDILQILKNFVSDQTKSVLFSTHITSDLEKIADFVSFLHKGSLVFTSSMKEIQQNLLLIKCTDNDYGKINPKDIIIEYKEDNVNRVLVTKSSKNNIYCEMGNVPTIDDIMLVYIKGTNK